MKVKTMSGTIVKVKTEPLYLGRKKINVEVAKQNLQDFSELMNIKKIDFILMYGTLLGAIRENGIIKHDEDIDIGLKIEDFDRFLNAFSSFQDKGFYLVRVDKRGFCSIMRNGEYIDMYFFSPYIDDIFNCCGNFVFKKFLYDTKKYTLYGKEYSIPMKSEEFLSIEYGQNWKIPTEYKQSDFGKIKSLFIHYLKFLIPNYMKTIIYLRKDKKKYLKFKDKLISNGDKIE